MHHRLFETADSMELIALYKTLPLMPYAKEHMTKALEGIRSNSPTVFNAIFLDNPYPSENFSEAEWNNGVLKAAFIEGPFNRIYGLEKRRNPALEESLFHYTCERKAASRLISEDITVFLDQKINKSPLIPIKPDE